MVDGGGGLDDVQILPGGHEVADGVGPISGDRIGGDTRGRGNENQGPELEAAASVAVGEERGSTEWKD